MTDPATLSLADLAAAVVRLGAHLSKFGNVVDSRNVLLIAWVEAGGDIDLLLAAANRLPVVVARVEALEAERAELAKERDFARALTIECRDRIVGDSARIASLEQDNAALRNFAVCAWCGPFVKVDEDGCCAHCGADCMLVADGRATIVPEHWRNDIDAVVSFDAPGACCDGDHGEPACSDAECWQRSAQHFAHTVRPALPALLADHARLGQLCANNAHNLDVVGASVDRLRAELTAERDAHHATCDALARERAEHTRDTIASQGRIAAEQDANRELRRDIERIREEAAQDRLAAARAIREMGEMEVAHRAVEVEVARLREGLEVQHMAEANRIAGAGGCCGGCDAAWLTAEVARLTDERDQNGAAVVHLSARRDELLRTVYRAASILDDIGRPNNAAAIRKEAAGE